MPLHDFGHGLGSLDAGTGKPKAKPRITARKKGREYRRAFERIEAGEGVTKITADSKKAGLIPTCTDQNPCAHCRMPMDMIFHGRSMSLFQASQQSATISS